MMWDDGDGRWAGMHDNGAGWFMVLLMLVLVVAVAVAVIAFVRGTVPTTAGHAAAAPRVPDPRAVLRERFARGDIDEPDFRARMRALDETGPAGT